jgi:mannan endo-1,6-alpha-mannosidase
MRLFSILTPLLGLTTLAQARYDLDLNSPDSIKSVTSSLAYDMMSFYHGNESGGTPGLLPGPCASVECYYWWEAGAMFAAMINYWQYTGDDSYNSVVMEALQFQRGPEENFNPPNQSKNMGVDDQDFWAFAAMDAAEANLPDMGGDAPSWLALAQAVFNFQTGLWDDASCGGGMRWQVYSFNAGYNLKNTISNGGYFQLAARLARYTGNDTYTDWAVKMYDWMAQSKLFQETPDLLYIWDNTDTNNGCIDMEHHAWSYNYGTMLAGCAYLYNLTEDQQWATRAEHILDGAFTLFFPQTMDGVQNANLGGNVMTEFQCEPTSICNQDQSSFKAYLARWMAVTAHLIPQLNSKIMPKLASSAQAAMNQCIGGNNGRMCGRQWYSSTWDGSSGVGQQVSFLRSIHPVRADSLTDDSSRRGGRESDDATDGPTDS